MKYVTGITGSQLTAISNSIPYPQLTRKPEKPDILLLGFITGPSEPNVDSLLERRVALAMPALCVKGESCT